jgi:hypothetical protein
MAENPVDTSVVSETNESSPAAVPTIDDMVNKAQEKMRGVSVKKEIDDKPVQKTGDDFPDGGTDIQTDSSKPVEADPVASDVEIDDDLRRLIDELKIDDVSDGDAGDTSSGSREEPSLVAIKEIAGRLGIKAETLDDLERGVAAKIKSASSYTEETEPLREIDQALALDDRELIAAVRKYEGYSDEEAAQYLDNLEKSQNKEQIKNEALHIRVSLRNERKKIESVIEQRRAQADSIRSQFENDIRSRVMKMDKVYGVPIDKQENGKFADEILSREFDKVLENPDEYLQLMRLKRDFAKVRNYWFEQGARAGANKIVQKYKSKLNNADPAIGGRAGSAPREEKKDTLDSNVDKAKAAIRAKAGGMIPRR